MSTEALELQAFERYGPLAGGILACLLVWLLFPSAQAQLELRSKEIDSALGPIFDLATFSAGSLFTIYVLALSRSDGFLGGIMGTKTFRAFHVFVAKAIALCFALSLWSTYHMVFSFGDISAPWTQFLVSMWVGMSVWALLAVGRVVAVFLIIIGAKGKRTSRTPVEQ